MRATIKLIILTIFSLQLTYAQDNTSIDSLDNEELVSEVSAKEKEVPQGFPGFTIVNAPKPKFCPSGGLELKDGYVRTKHTEEMIDIIIYLQNYDNTWAKKHFVRKGAGFIPLNISSCNYTGNFYAFARYASNKNKQPSLNDVKKKHESMGKRPKFRINRQAKLKHCKEGGTHFIEGQVFTPNGEAVDITLFMQKKDGTWRKKHFKSIGSGYIPIDVKGCDLNGKYKARVVLTN